MGEQMAVMFRHQGIEKSPKKGLGHTMSCSLLAGLG
jgi:hypothetical protein